MEHEVTTTQVFCDLKHRGHRFKNGEVKRHPATIRLQINGVADGETTKLDLCPMHAEVFKRKFTSANGTAETEKPHRVRVFRKQRQLAVRVKSKRR